MKIMQIVQGVKQYTPQQTREPLYAKGYVKIGGTKYKILNIEVDSRDSNWLHVYVSETPLVERDTSLEDDFYYNPMNWNTWKANA